MFHRHMWSGWTRGVITIHSPHLNTSKQEWEILIRECMSRDYCGKRRQIRDLEGKKIRLR